MAQSKSQSIVGRQSLVLFVTMMTLLPAVISQGGIRYPATIQTKGGTSGTAQVELKEYDNYEKIFFNYAATLEMGSTAKIDIQGSTDGGDKIISNGKQPGEEFTRFITQKVTKSRDARGIHLSVYIQTTLKLAEGKEKYGKTTIGVRVAPGRRGAHYWDIKHEYSNNYEGEDEGEICLGCGEAEEDIQPAFYVTPSPTPEPGERWDGKPFVYKWGVNDSPSQNLFNSAAESDGDTVRGEYRTLLPDGRTQVVTYTADWKNGYRALIKYE